MTGTGVIVPLDLLRHEYGLRAAKDLRPTDWINTNMLQEEGEK